MRRPALILALVATACTPSVGGPTTVAPLPPTTATTVPVTSTIVTTSTVADVVDPVLEEVMALIQVTEELRELRFLAEPTVTILSQEELAERVESDIAEELDPADLARDQEALRILGVLDGDLDLGEFYTRLLGEQVAGFYDSETKEMVIPASPEGLTEYDKLVIVHELTHALTDQHFDFGPLRKELSEEEEFDASAALIALLEGDATQVETLYLQSLSPGDLMEILSGFDDLSSPIFDSAPHFIQESLVAPYIEGVEFVADQFAAGGWSAVDLAYRSPPPTTEQILHGAAFAAGEPGMVLELVGEPPEGYEVGELSTWGESGLRALLGAVLLPDALTAATEGWGGDRYRVLWDGEQAIFQLQYVGDSPQDSDEFAEGFTQYLDALAPSDADWRILRRGDEVAVVVSSSSASTSIVNALKNAGFR